MMEVCHILLYCFSAKLYQITEYNAYLIFSGAPLVLGKGEPDGGPLSPVVQVGIHAGSHQRCVNHRLPNVLTRVSMVADWVKDTVCQRMGELCKSSKSGKNSKTKKIHPNCVKVPTDSPTYFVTQKPTATAQPITPIPTYMPTTPWPTWMPTSEGMSCNNWCFEYFFK